jgi:class 3 adenylate cyclase
MIRRAARAFERAYIILVKAEESLDLLTAVVEIGSQVFVEFGAGVHLGLVLRRHTGIEPAVKTLQVELLHDEQSGVDGGGHFGG